MVEKVGRGSQGHGVVAEVGRAPSVTYPVSAEFGESAGGAE